MYIPKQLKTSTVFSKLLVGFMFITLTFVGFWLGMHSQQYLSQLESSQVSNTTNLALIDFVDFDDNLSRCSPSASDKNFGKQFIIRSSKEYYFDIGTGVCKDFPTVDFSQYTLLGKYTESGGCSVNTKKEVFKDEGNEEILYKITLQEMGKCKMLSTSMNWILIPKIDKTYSVKFEVANVEATDQF